MKILVAIPFLCGRESSYETIKALGEVDIFALNNGARDEVIDVLNRFKFHKRVDLSQNIYVNPAWNIFMKYFLESDYDRLIIMNNDLVVCKEWKEVCDMVWTENPDTIILPNLSENGESVGGKVTSGTPGVFITLNKKQSEMVYPIPDYIKVWYGDDWIFSILRAFYDTIIISDMKARHYGSMSIKEQDIFDQIDKDKIEWASKGQKDIEERIKQIKNDR